MRVLFTDLDGTFLDHHTYQPGPALPALHRLRRAGVLVLPATAKTLAEVRHLGLFGGAPSTSESDRKVPLLTGGAVVENGAAFVIGSDLTVLGTPYPEIRVLLKEAAAEAGADVLGYGDMTADQVAAETGLTPAEAARAQQRQWSETFRITSGDPDALAAALDRRGLRAVRGARFLTAMGDHDKGTAARLVLDRLRRAGPVRSWAVGDAANDAELLAAVDHPMVVRAKHGDWVDLDLPGLTRLDGTGPAGWVLGAGEILRVAAHGGLAA